MHGEQGHHVLAVVGHHQGVGLARRLEHVAAFFGHPVVLQIQPFAAQHMGMHHARMAVALQQARAFDFEQVHIKAARHVQVQRARPNALAHRRPQALVLGLHIVHHHVGGHAPGLRFGVRQAVVGGRWWGVGCVHGSGGKELKRPA